MAAQPVPGAQVSMCSYVMASIAIWLAYPQRVMSGMTCPGLAHALMRFAHVSSCGHAVENLGRRFIAMSVWSQLRAAVYDFVTIPYQCHYTTPLTEQGACTCH